MNSNHANPPKWLPMESHGPEWYDGETFLGALQVSGNGKVSWEFWRLRISCDAEDHFDVIDDATGETFSVWDLSDFEFYIPIEGY